MASSLVEFINQAKRVITNLPPAKRITLLALIGCTIAGFIVLLTWAGKSEFGNLYSNLTLEDAGAIVAKLKEKKIEYRISSNGSSILIPKDMIYETRMELASHGLPQGGGVGFEIFDDTKLGMTEFVQNVNYQRALQGELSRTINRFDEVVSSRVHIVMPSKSLFVEEEKPASASVVLKLRRGCWLNKNQIQGIVYLVSSSVSGLVPESVTIIDNRGKMLAGFEEKSTPGRVSTDQLEFQKKIERSLEDRVKTMLDTALGDGKSVVRISCALDFKRHEKTEEMYYPENQVARSEQLSSAVSNGTANVPAGIPGVTSNISPVQTQPGSGDQKTKFEKKDRTVNYEIGKVINHVIEPVGTIKRLSVAVIVDGTYKFVKSIEANADKEAKENKKGNDVKEAEKGDDEKGGWEYIPRTKEEMQKLEGIVKRAVNFDAQRGDEMEIVNIPFETSRLNDDIEDVDGWFSKIVAFKPYLKYLISGFILLFSFVFVVRPLIKWLTSDSIRNIELIAQLPKTVDEIEREYAQRTGLPYKSRALGMIANKSERLAQLMKDWLREK